MNTPGPWRVVTFNDASVNVIGPDHGFVCAVGGIADGAPDTDTIRADARLIAAAPDLLSALERIMTYAGIGASVSDVNTQEQPEFIDARTAIAKARAS